MGVVVVAQMNRELQPSNVLAGEIIAMVVVILDACTYHVIRAKAASRGC